jgi:serine protease Do
VLNGGELQVAISNVTPGTKVQLGVLRNGHPQNVDLTIGEYHADGQVASNDGDGNGASGQGGKLGLAMADLTADVRQQLNLPDGVKGAAIQGVRSGSPAEDAGLQPGDVIVQINRHDVDSASQVVSSVRAIPKGQDVLLLVWSKGGASYRVVHPDQG